MARKLRIQYPGAMDHVMNRGDHGEVIFRDDKDRPTLSDSFERDRKQNRGPRHPLQACARAIHSRWIVRPKGGAETTVTIAWIAQRLWMGSRRHLRPWLYQRAKPNSTRPSPGRPASGI